MLSFLGRKNGYDDETSISGASKVLTFGLYDVEMFQIRELCDQSQKIVLSHVARFYGANPTLFKIITR
jgi:hypothetical protein